jgi:hypothetical protein
MFLLNDRHMLGKIDFNQELTLKVMRDQPENETIIFL